MTKRIVILFTFLSAAVNVFAQKNYPADVKSVLDKAGDNRGQLERVLQFYQSDEQKLKAAYYLISNMEGHSFIISSLYDTNKIKIDFDILDYPDYDSLQAGFRELENRYGTLDFSREFEYFDVDTINADFLIKQIDLAFKAWREKPWAKKLTFVDFCDYVLPYRGSNEPLEDWRGYFLEKYEWVEKKMRDTKDAVEAAGIINEDIAEWFHFDPRFYYHPTDQGLSDFLRNKIGRCEDMTNVTIYAMRANGLAVTSDFTPYWAKSGNNHAWNAILLPEGKLVPFMGGESSPGRYHLSGQVAKVYRKMFRRNPDNLVFHIRPGYKMPPYISDESIMDVTKDYTEVCTVKIEMDDIKVDSVDKAYICVFNSGEWKAIDWAEIKGQYATFEDMGMDIAYLGAFYEGGKIITYGDPFILNRDGSRSYLKADIEKTTNISLVSTTKRVQVVSTDGAEVTNLKSGKVYELFYWNNGWQSLGSKSAGDKSLVFEKVPTGGLLWLTEEDSDREEERIFTVEDGKIVWW